MRRLLPIVLASLLLAPASAGAMASHRGWPPYDGMLLMNEADSTRPLDARTGMDVFGGVGPYACKDTSSKLSSSCEPWLRHDSGNWIVRDSDTHNRLYGGHGNDTIYAGDNGDVLWGDYKPSGQPTSQSDTLIGGDGPDFIYASHGRNAIQGGAGTDVIHAHFGRGTIDCGPGRDIAYIHGKRRGAYDITNCEVVTRTVSQSAPAWVLARLPWPITDTQSRE